MHLLDANTQHISTVCLALLCSYLPLHVRWRRRRKTQPAMWLWLKSTQEQTKQDPWLTSSPLLHLATSSFSGSNPADLLPHPHPEPKVTSQMRGSVYPHLNSNHLLLAGGLWLLLRFPALEHEGCGALWWLCGKQALHRINKSFLSSCHGRESNLLVFPVITAGENNRNNSPVGGLTWCYTKLHFNLVFIWLIRNSILYLGNAWRR